RPMLFFAYDLEAYRDTLRGLYLDFEEWAPGPVLRTSEDLLSALRTAEDDRDRYADRYARFLERFCALEDGSAAARVVDSVFGG
ncbi:MAG: CDP-glycerol glycerophosphotransferase family protein, partial [Mycobacteriales bacterium]